MYVIVYVPEHLDVWEDAQGLPIVEQEWEEELFVTDEESLPCLPCVQYMVICQFETKETALRALRSCYDAFLEHAREEWAWQQQQRRQA